MTPSPKWEEDVFRDVLERDLVTHERERDRARERESERERERD